MVHVCTNKEEVHLNNKVFFPAEGEGYCMAHTRGEDGNRLRVSDIQGETGSEP